MNDLILKDVSLNRFIYYLSEASGDSEKQIKSKEELFENTLNQAVKGIGDWGKTVRKNPPPVFRKPGYRLLLAESLGDNPAFPQWILDPETSIARKLISQSLLDIFYIQTAVGKSGDIRSDQLPEVIRSLPSLELPEIGTRLSASGTCVFFETNLDDAKRTGNIAKVLSEHLDAVFQRTLTVLGRNSGKFYYADLGFAVAGILEDIFEATWIVVDTQTGGGGAALNAAGLADIFLSEFFLSVSKIANEKTSARASLIKAKQKGNEMESYIDSLPKKRLSLQRMENISERLSDLRTEMALEMNKTRHHLETVKINIANIERAIDRASMEAMPKENLKGFLMPALSLVRDQLEADLSYLEIGLKHGDHVSQKYNGITQVRLGYYSRAIAIAFGLISILGCLQLFKEFTDLDIWIRVGVIGTFLILVTTLVFSSGIKGSFDG